MYLVNVDEKASVVQVSFSGGVEAGEVRALSHELARQAKSFAGQPFYVLLDYSRAQRLGEQTIHELAWVKDGCLAMGASQIVTVTAGESDRLEHENARLQQVLEGRELYVAEGSGFAMAA